MLLTSAQHRAMARRFRRKAPTLDPKLREVALKRAGTHLALARAQDANPLLAPHAENATGLGAHRHPSHRAEQLCGQTGDHRGYDNEINWLWRTTAPSIAEAASLWHIGNGLEKSTWLRQWRKRRGDLVGRCKTAAIAVGAPRAGSAQRPLCRGRGRGSRQGRCGSRQ
jgi:hypothetical protein